MINEMKNPDFWKGKAYDPLYERLLSRLDAFYQNDRCLAYSTDWYDTRRLFAEKGSRQEFETPYFARRRFLASAALLSLLYPQKQEYLNALADMLRLVNSEFSWALPAHTNHDPKNCPAECFVDLFAAETGGMVAEICVLLQDRLPVSLRQEIQENVERRIFAPYEQYDFWWKRATHNWVTVCAGNVALAMIALRPDLFDTNKNNLTKQLSQYLDATPNDGTCLEGFGYWHYGFGSLVWAAGEIYDHTQGEINLFAHENFVPLANYPSRSYLKNGCTISAADGSDKNKTFDALLYRLSSLFPDEITLLPDEYLDTWNGTVIWLSFTRSFLYLKPNTCTEFSLKDCFLAESGQAVIHKKNYSLFVKAGHNDEPHNHNDIGSYILCTQNGQALCDIGTPRYTRDYFNHMRYTYVVPCSRGHGVPIVNGKYQKAGKAYGGTIAQIGNTVTVSFASAYGMEELKALDRTLTAEEAFVTLTDSFDIDYKSFIERFVSKKQPTVTENTVTIDDVRILFDPALVTVSVTTESYEHHAQPKGECDYPLSEDGFPLIPVYFVDFDLKKGLKQITFTIAINN